MKTKKCNRCKETLNENKFGKKKDRNGEYKYIRYICKQCERERGKEIAKTQHRKKWKKKYDLEKTYGLTLKEFETMMSNQSSKCKICDTNILGKKAAHVDHCHKTGKIRGLLCLRCNRGIGYFDDDPKTLMKAAEYCN